MDIQQTLTVELPTYCTPRNAWRLSIHQAVIDAAHGANMSFTFTDKLEVIVQLYMTESMLAFHDVDNRLKDVLDALQGRAGGPKNTHDLDAIIPNDRQIFKATIEKLLASPDCSSGGKLTVRKLIQ